MASSSTSETKIEVKCTKTGGSNSNGISSEDKNGCGCKCHRVPVTLRDHFWRDPFFSSNWEDFDKIRQQMIEDSKQMWSKFNEDFSRMGTTSSSSSSALSRSVKSFCSKSKMTSLDTLCYEAEEARSQIFFK